MKCSKASSSSNEESATHSQVTTTPDVPCNSKTAHSRTGCANDETVSQSESRKQHSESSKKMRSVEDKKGEPSWMDFKLKRNRRRVMNDESESSSSQNTSRAAIDKYAQNEKDNSLDLNGIKLRHCNVLVRKLSPSDINKYCQEDTDPSKRKKQSSKKSKARKSVAILPSSSSSSDDDDEDDIVLSKMKKGSTQEMKVSALSSDEEVGINMNEWVVTSATGEDSDGNSESDLEDNSRRQQLTKCSRTGVSARCQNDKTGCSSGSKGQLKKSVKFGDSKPTQSCEKKTEHFNDNLRREKEKLEPKKRVKVAPAKSEDQDQMSNNDSCD